MISSPVVLTDPNHFAIEPSQFWKTSNSLYYLLFQAISDLPTAMSCEEEVVSVRKQLEKMSGEEGDQSQALDLLKCLGKLAINLQILTNTR